MNDIYILKTGSTLPGVKKVFGDFEQWIGKDLAACGFFPKIVDVEKGEPLPASTAGAAIITGSPAMVTDQLPWMIELCGWIRQAVDQKAALLGICFGHQIIAAALGGVVDYHPRGREIGTVNIELTQNAQSDPLFAALPPLFRAQATHAQSVLQLPPGAVHLARNDYEPHHGFCVNGHVWGIQYHPEFSADIMRCYIIEQHEKLLAQGLAVADLLAGIKHTPVAASLTCRFADFAKRHYLAKHEDR